MSRLSICLLLVVVACGGQQSGPELEGEPAPDTPVAAVEALVEAVGVADFARAGQLAVPGQAALASLAEGATAGEVARAIEDGDDGVAANFWAGFAQGSGAFLVGDVSAEDAGSVSEEDVEFSAVTVVSEGELERTVLVREQDGYRVDLFASFGAGIADKMLGPVERLLQAQTADAALILTELRGVVPSLLVAAYYPGTAGEASQNLLALVEVITRVR